MMVKICGITRREDAVAAAEAGASALGFIFYPKSPRYVTPEQARELGDGLAPWKVGVFVDESPETVKRTVAEANLDVVQIYGPPNFPPAVRVWLATRVGIAGPSYGVAHGPRAAVEALFLDGLTNGTSFDWNVVHQFAGRFPAHIVIAGGLNPSNVAEAIRIAKPWGVDASSGLESSPGIKDHEKVRQFVVNARDAAQEASQ